MKGKTVLILLVTACVLVGLAFLRFGERSNPTDAEMGQKLFADLPVNAVDQVTVADSENKVTLVKGETVWQVQERSGYAADFDALRNTVVKLSRLKIGRSFSGSPESLDRLSLNAPSADASQGVGKQIRLADSSGKILGDIILGQTRQTDGGGAGGQYLKKVDSDTVFLVDGDFQFLKTAPAEWLQKEVLNIKADTIASVACHTGDGDNPLFTLTRTEKGQPAQMTPVPGGRTADSSKIDQVFDALAPLTLDDVRSADGLTPATETDRPRLVYRLYDGRQVTIFPDEDDNGKHTLRITAETSEPEAAVAEPAEPVKTDATDEGEKPAEAGEKTNGDKEKAETVVKTAEQLNTELMPWVFIVKEWQFNSFITQPESLLEAVKAEGEETS